MIPRSRHRRKRGPCIRDRVVRGDFIHGQSVSLTTKNIDFSAVRRGSTCSSWCGHIRAASPRGQIRIKFVDLPVREESWIGIPARQVDLDPDRSEEHTSELQSRRDLVCRLLLEKKKKINESK